MKFIVRKWKYRIEGKEKETTTKEDDLSDVALRKIAFLNYEKIGFGSLRDFESANVTIEEIREKLSGLGVEILSSYTKIEDLPVGFP